MPGSKGTEKHTVSRTTRVDDLPELLSVEEFRRVAGLGRSVAYMLARSGELPVVRFGKTIRVYRNALLPKTDGEDA